MITKLVRLIKQIGYKIRFGKKVCFDGVPNCERHSTLKIKNGSLHIGKHFHLRSGSYIAVVAGGQVTVGDNVFINRNCSIVCRDRIQIGSRCAFGPNVIIYDHDHRFDTDGVTTEYKTSAVEIGDRCWIGAGAIILRGTHIGEGCVIGAGTVVKGDIPPHSLVSSEGTRTLKISPIDDRQKEQMKTE